MQSRSRATSAAVGCPGGSSTTMGSGRDPIRVQVVDHPEVDPGGRFLGHERAYHGAPRCFVAVDNADQQ
jgi:hypothetical protein